MGIKNSTSRRRRRQASTNATEERRRQKRNNNLTDEEKYIFNFICIAQDERLRDARVTVKIYWKQVSKRFKEEIGGLIEPENARKILERMLKEKLT